VKKRTPPKLVLNRETLKPLGGESRKDELQAVVGAFTNTYMRNCSVCICQ